MKPDKCWVAFQVVKRQHKDQVAFGVQMVVARDGTYSNTLVPTENDAIRYIVTSLESLDRADWKKRQR